MDIEAMLRSAGLLDESRGVGGSVSELVDQVLVLRHERAEAIKALGAGNETYTHGRLDIAASIAGVRIRAAAPIGVKIDIEIAREDDGRWIADVTTVPGCTAYGETKAKAMALVLRLVADVFDAP